MDGFQKLRPIGYTHQGLRQCTSSRLNGINNIIQWLFENVIAYFHGFTKEK